MTHDRSKISSVTRDGDQIRRVTQDIDRTVIMRDFLFYEHRMRDLPIRFSC